MGIRAPGLRRLSSSKFNSHELGGHCNLAVVKPRTPWLFLLCLACCHGKELINLVYLILFYLFLKIYLFICFLAVLGLRCCTWAFSRAGATLPCGAQASHCCGFSCHGAQALGSQASVVVARGLSSCGSRALECRLSSCGARTQLLRTCGIFLDQGSNPCPLNWQVDS